MMVDVKSKLEVVPVSFKMWCTVETNNSKKKLKNRTKELSEKYGTFCCEYRRSTEFGKQILVAKYG